MDFTKEQIREKFETLPSALKKAIVYAEMEEIAESLKTRYGLHIDQLNRLANEITLVLVGLVPNSDFQRRIMKNVGLAEDVANLVTYDLNRELFAKIRASLREGEGQTNGGMSESETNRDEFEGGNEVGEKEAGEENGEKGTITPKPSPNQTSKQMFDQKMTGLSGQAKQTVEVETKTGDNEGVVAPVKARDPYREPV